MAKLFRGVVIDHLLGDALLIRGFDIADIYSATKSSLHKITPWAKVHGFATYLSKNKIIFPV